MFKKTIEENIAYGKIGSSADEIYKAAEAANIAALLRQNLLSENKDELYSKGQKERISLASLILKKPKIFLFDKATVGLDKISAYEMQKVIFDKGINTTTVVVSDRAVVLQKCDFVFFLHKGKIVEQGTHEDLMHTKGLYFDLFKLQL